jgi:hypothetical protein
MSSVRVGSNGRGGRSPWIIFTIDVTDGRLLNGIMPVKTFNRIKIQIQ